MSILHRHHDTDERRSSSHCDNKKMKMKKKIFVEVAVLALVISSGLVLIFWIYIPEYIFGSRFITDYHYDIIKIIKAKPDFWSFHIRLMSSDWQEKDAEKILKSGFLNSKDADQRRYAILALEYILGKPSKYIPIIINTFSDAELTMPEDSLYRYGNEAYPYLRKALNSNNPLVRRRVCKALRFVDKDKAYPLLKQVLRTDHDKDTRAAAMRTLCVEVGNPAIIPDILHVIRNENDPKRKDLYISRLTSLKSPLTVEALLQLIKEGEVPAKPGFRGVDNGLFSPIISVPAYDGELPPRIQAELRQLLHDEVFSVWAKLTLEQCGYIK